MTLERNASTWRKVKAEDSTVIREHRVRLDTDEIPYLSFHKQLITTISAEEKQTHSRPAGQQENTADRGGPHPSVNLGSDQTRP